MKQKRTTIYDIAKALNIHATYVSKALNEHSNISQEMIDKVKKKAAELKYRHNSSAANFRASYSKTCGVIVPKINESFFSNAIAGIEEVCAQNGHHLIICQSLESYTKEVEAIETLIRQNVDCIIISLSLETKNSNHLQEVLANGITLIQFDRYDESILSYIVKNDNREAAGRAVKHLLDQRYRRIAYIGGPEHLRIYIERKQGFIDTIREAQISIPYEYTCNISLRREESRKIALELLNGPNPPDAFFTASDFAALGVMQAAKDLNIPVPGKLGIFGFQNEEFTQYLTPTLSTVDQKSMELGALSARLYFSNLQNKEETGTSGNYKTEVVKCSLITNQSSVRSSKDPSQS
ncbi:LacI family DNA-binding transcriptional regulator [Chitinophaga tropicalis]|uniref:Substrate-binding domain-containing protein n=1 Tax=Chitinophaga tropicalis TaxID=2683588 RepID=A0A7K1U359_9BACT|nr:LacI family DNA-binding transcriptional regulator [Chitinophaga tropicalis]MVT08797.1 substrate-binding domain-containing protein [Chitinophaga tropicalis]